MGLQRKFAKKNSKAVLNSSSWADQGIALAKALFSWSHSHTCLCWSILNRGPLFRYPDALPLFTDPVNTASLWTRLPADRRIEALMLLGITSREKGGLSQKGVHHLRVLPEAGSLARQYSPQRFDLCVCSGSFNC